MPISFFSSYWRLRLAHLRHLFSPITFPLICPIPLFAFSSSTSSTLPSSHPIRILSPAVRNLPGEEHLFLLNLPPSLSLFSIYLFRHLALGVRWRHLLLCSHTRVQLHPAFLTGTIVSILHLSRNFALFYCLANRLRLDFDPCDFLAIALVCSRPSSGHRKLPTPHRPPIPGANFP